MKRITEVLDGERYFSVEFFPPKTEKGVENLVARAKRLQDAGARFISVTWGAGGTSAAASLALASRLKEELTVPVLLHLTCTNMDQTVLEKTLQTAKQSGLVNILALRGDPPRNDYAYSTDFNNAADLVAWIRATYGDFFCIGVAGYPEGHAQGSSMDHCVAKDMPFLMKKVRNGADFIITQLFYDAGKFVEYEQTLRDHPSGLFDEIPIIPGLMPINTYKTLVRSAKLSSASIPAEIHERMKQVALQDDEQVKQVGVELLCQLVHQLQQQGVRGVHFYTLNLEKSVLAIVQCAELGHKVETQVWDDFTNGRYTDPDSAAFGELDGYGPVVHGAVDGAPNQAWGELGSSRDVADLLVRHITNEVDVTPFADAPLNAETSLIQEELIEFNERDMWTLASQPAVNGADSTDKMVGWGPASGKIFQHSFVELLITAEQWAALKPKLDQIQAAAYIVVDSKGQLETNCAKDEKLVVTWGTWGDSTQSSTIITKQSCLAWGGEVHDILINWRNLYPKESKSWATMDEAASTRVLATIVFKSTVQEFWHVI